MKKPKSKLKRRSACDVVKGTPWPRLDARLVKNELEAFLLYINENMITKIVENSSFLTEFEKNERKYCRHTEFDVVDETLRKRFYASYNCDFKVYMKGKPGIYDPLLWILADTQDRYGSRVIPYVTLPINNPEKREISMT